jgi:prophage tail gpP-like protein
MDKHDQDAVSIVIGTKKFEKWSSATITRSIDTYSTVHLSAPSEPENQEFRDTFRPFSYTPIQAQIGGFFQVTGYLIDILPNSTPEEYTVEGTGYAKPAPFGDVTMPGDFRPLEFKGLKLNQIAEQIAAPFGVDVVFEADQGAKFDKVKLEPGDKIQDFLVGLAKQRKLVINDTEKGELRFWQSVEPGNPVADFTEGEQPMVRITPQFNPQAYYSEITAIADKKRGIKGSQYTVKNPWLTDVVRPFTFNVDDTEAADVPAAAAAALGRMFGEAAGVVLDDIPTWRDPQGELFKPNTTVTLVAPHSMIYRRTEYIIRDVTRRREADKKTTSLKLVLPGAFSGEVPESLPWIE